MRKLSLSLVGFLLCAIQVFGQQDVKLFEDNAARYAKEKKYAEAVVEITKAIEIQPKDAGLFITRARYYSYLQEREAVLRDVRTGISLSPSDTRILKTGAMWLLLSGQYEESLKIGDSLIKLDENNPEGYEVLCRNLFLLKDYAGALENYIKVFELKPLSNSLGPGYLFDSLKNLKDDKVIFNYYNRVFNTLEKVVIDSAKLLPENSSDLKVDNIRARNNVIQFGSLLQILALDWAKLHEKKGETERSKEVLEKMVQFEPRVVAYERRADYHRQNGRIEEAEADQIKVAELFIEEINKTLALYGDAPRKAETFLRRGDLYVRAKQFDKAISDYEKAATLNPGVKEAAERKIDLARQKMRENLNQPD